MNVGKILLILVQGLVYFIAYECLRTGVIDQPSDRWAFLGLIGFSGSAGVIILDLLDNNASTRKDTE